VTGTLYGVGVGPGDPELMTVKAWRLISTAKTIAYLAANGGESTARSIAKHFIADDASEIIIDMPMRVERQPAQTAYDDGAARISARLERGEDIVMLCEGDPFFYGSFIHIYERLSSKYKVNVVPGVTSVNAAATETGSPLATRDGVIKILPATLGEDRLRDELMTCESVAIIKVGRHFEKIRKLLATLDLLPFATAIELATHAEQRIRAVSKINEPTMPYFTTILVNTNRRPT
jgi:precorrin-2/cobalt-factor-2 C20-methyltransferase